MKEFPLVNHPLGDIHMTSTSRFGPRHPPSNRSGTREWPKACWPWSQSLKTSADQLIVLKKVVAIWLYVAIVTTKSTKQWNCKWPHDKPVRLISFILCSSEALSKQEIDVGDVGLIVVDSCWFCPKQQLNHWTFTKHRWINPFWTKIQTATSDTI